MEILIIVKNFFFFEKYTCEQIFQNLFNKNFIEISCLKKNYQKGFQIKLPKLILFNNVILY